MVNKYFMNLLISGCSFTNWPEYSGGPNTCWPRYLQELNPTWTITNIGEPGAGNQYISDSVIRHIVEHPGKKYDHVLVMWTGVSRLDYLTNLEDPNWEELYNSYGFCRRVDSCPEKLGYIFSGGQLGTWFNNRVSEKIFRDLYKVSSPLSLATINLMEMIKLQNFLENNNLSYHFMSYVDYWGTGEHLSPNGDFGLGQFAELKNMLGSIHWDRWIFNNQRNGLYELSLHNRDFQADGFHPGSSTHQQWAEIVNQQF